MVRLGLNGKFTRGTAGGTPSTEVLNCKDLSANLSVSLADITTRGSGGWREQAAALKELELEWKMLVDPDDADYVAVSAAFHAGTPLALGVTPGTSGGLVGDFVISEFGEEQPLEDAIAITVKAVPTKISGSSARNPSWTAPAVSSGTTTP